MSALVVNLAGIILMAFIVWWFWLWTPRAATTADDGVVTITVADGVYDPARIRTRQGRPVTLRFVRTDPSPCAQQVIFEDLGITEELPLNEPTDIRIPADETGSWRFTCQMQMYQGWLTIEPG